MIIINFILALKNCNLWYDFVGKAGRVSSYLPVISWK